VKSWFRISIRDIIWLTVVVALGVCVYQERFALRRASMEMKTLYRELQTAKAQVVSRDEMLERQRRAYVTQLHMWSDTVRLKVPPIDDHFSYDAMRLFFSNADCVILGQVEDEPREMTEHEAGKHMSGDYTVRIVDIAKGSALLVGKRVTLDVDLLSDHPLRPRQGDKRTFFLNLKQLNDFNNFATTDIRFAVEPASMFYELKRLADERREKVGSPPTLEVRSE